MRRMNGDGAPRFRNEIIAGIIVMKNYVAPLLIPNS